MPNSPRFLERTAGWPARPGWGIRCRCLFGVLPRRPVALVAGRRARGSPGWAWGRAASRQAASVAAKAGVELDRRRAMGEPFPQRAWPVPFLVRVLVPQPAFRRPPLELGRVTPVASLFRRPLRPRLPTTAHRSA